jgi:hypothetical protein
MTETVPPGTTRYYCPLDCGWFHEVPPSGLADLAGIRPAADVVALQDVVDSTVQQAMLRRAEETESAIRQHVATHGIHTADELRAAIAARPDPGSST